ncbi:hypothetical protein AgCh_009130 [Apium graveolens]
MKTRVVLINAGQANAATDASNSWGISVSFINIIMGFTLHKIKTSLLYYKGLELLNGPVLLPYDHFLCRCLLMKFWNSLKWIL